MGASDCDEFLWAAWCALGARRPEGRWPVFVDERGTNTSPKPLYAFRRARSPRRAEGGGAQPWQEHDAYREHDIRGDGALPGSHRKHHRRVLRVLRRVGPSARFPPRQIVATDNLNARKTERMCQLIEVKGCSMLGLPTYSSELNLIE